MSKKEIPLSGKLEKYSVLRLLQGIMEEGRTGCLRVTRDGAERKLYVREGMIIYASSTEERDRLGEIFVAQGKLTQEEMAEAFARSLEQGARLGRVLLVEGRITSLDLFQGVTVQVVSIIEKMRNWRKGDFVFDDEDPPEGSVLLRIPLSLYLGSAERRKAAPRRKTEVKAADLAEEAAKEEAGKEESDDFEEEIIIEEDFAGEEVISDTGGEAPVEEESPVEEEVSVEALAAAEVAEALSEVPGPVAAETEAEVESAPDEPAAVGERWGEVVFEDEKDDGGNGDKEAAEAIFHLQELRDRRGGDAHTLLGVKSDASKEEIREAYHYLSGVLQPGRHPSGLADKEAEEMKELAGEVEAAYEKLTGNGEEEKVAASEAPLPSSGERMSAPSAALDPGDETRRLYFRAKKYIAGGNYWQASDMLRQVVRRKPKDAECRNLLGFCLMQTGRRLHEAEEHIKEAIKLTPGNPDYLVNLGLVYKAGRSFKQARAIFQQALLYDKNHAMARHELRNLPSDIEWGRESGGFWKKLFGK